MKYLSRMRATLMVLLLAASGAGLAQNNLQVTAAWYGVEGGQQTAVVNGAPIMDKLRNAVVNGTLMVPSNMNVFFGGDPYPGVKKVLAVQVMQNGQLVNLRQNEGTDLVFPGTPGKTYLPAPVDSPVEVLGAWYGLEGGQQSSAPAIADKIKRGLLNGYVYIPPDMNAFFGNDPVPGKVKKVAVAVRYRGVTLNLRQTEGRPLLFPGKEGEDYLVMLQATPAALQAEFDPAFYSLKYPDLQEAFGLDRNRLWEHYQRHGMREGRDPNANVSISALKMRYPYLVETYGDDNAGYINHYVAAGGRSRFNADPADTRFPDGGLFADPRLAYFDADYYFRKNPSVCADPNLVIPKGAPNGCDRANGPLMNVTALAEHYILKGAANGWKPNNMPFGPPQSANGKELMRAGDWLGVNEFLISRDGKSIAVMQTNADFAVYRAPNIKSVNAGNYAGHHSGFVSNENKDSFFVTMQGDGRLCTYKGTSPANNKGFIGCNAPEQPQGPYYVHLQSDTNLVIRSGTTMFDDRGYVWDFISTKPAKPGFFGKVVGAIRTIVGCR
ncbi:hypothetical protein [Massilia endophytica]|uniref:hypothetical protein n=1 Tax=Massilia endophytica TaxID=2899220 RepID=UPI001E5477D6|nr:hypothetical protein [Massilia endophytica]UGQ45904.1 hypothetical protein LSQ66_19265 [Massilia endophytica]